MMKHDLHHSGHSVERRAKEADVVSRARAASPIAGNAGSDVLKAPLDRSNIRSRQDIC